MNLFPAYRLYSNSVYAAMASKIGVPNLFILSAGWGLLSADFLTPKYDITFSGQAEPFKRRTRRGRFNDLNMLPKDGDAPVVFLGGKDYLSLFAHLTAGYPGQRIVIYNSDTVPKADGVTPVRYHTSTRTNWHYAAAKALLAGTLRVG